MSEVRGTRRGLLVTKLGRPSDEKNNTAIKESDFEGGRKEGPERWRKVPKVVWTDRPCCRSTPGCRRSARTTAFSSSSGGQCLRHNRAVAKRERVNERTTGQAPSPAATFPGPGTWTRLPILARDCPSSRGRKLQ